MMCLILVSRYSSAVENQLYGHIGGGSVSGAFSGVVPACTCTFTCRYIHVVGASADACTFKYIECCKPMIFCYREDIWSTYLNTQHTRYMDITVHCILHSTIITD